MAEKFYALVNNVHYIIQNGIWSVDIDEEYLSNG